MLSISDYTVSVCLFLYTKRVSHWRGSTYEQSVSILDLNGLDDHTQPVWAQGSSTGSSIGLSGVLLCHHALCTLCVFAHAKHLHQVVV